MSFDLRVGTNRQTYAASTAQASAAESAEHGTTKLTMGKSGGGDTVSISQQGKDKLAAMQSGSESEKSSENSSSIEQQIEKIQEQIKKLKEEIEKLQKEPEKNKDQIAAKQNQLMQYQGQLAELQNQQSKANGTSGAGGTRANGMSNSLT